MSKQEYEESRRVSNASFKTLVMAAMRRADTSNADKLRLAFPAIHDELWMRYNAPGGYLPGEIVEEEDDDPYDSR